MNAVWALDFMHGALYGGRAFRTLNVIDEANRGGLGIVVATRIGSRSSSSRSTGHSQAIRCDNGTELTSCVFTEWCQAQDIEMCYVQPGKPDQNAYIERFNRSYRQEVLNAYLFYSVTEVPHITDDWLRRYNEIRPHDALGSLPPARYREQVLEAKTPL